MYNHIPQAWQRKLVQSSDHRKGLSFAFTSQPMTHQASMITCRKVHKHGIYLGRNKVSCLERCPHFRGVLIEGFHCSYTRTYKLHMCTYMYRNTLLCTAGYDIPRPKHTCTCTCTYDCCLPYTCKCPFGLFFFKFSFCVLYGYYD